MNVIHNADICIFYQAKPMLTFNGKTIFTGIQVNNKISSLTTVMPTKSDRDIILCLQLLSKTLMCTIHLS